MSVSNNGAQILAGINTMIVDKKAEKIEKVLGFRVETIVLCHKQMTASGNEGVGPVTIKNATHLALNYCPETARKALIKHFELDERDLGMTRYEGLKKVLASEIKSTKVNFCTDNKKVLITLVNNDMVDALLEEMKSCDLNNPANVKKIIWDLTVIYRMYQELTIDAAKKCYVVDILIAVECVKPLSSQAISHVLQYSDEDKLEIKSENYRPLTKKNERLTIYQTTPEKNLADGTQREFFIDPINRVQQTLAEFLEELVDAAYNIKVEMPEVEVKRLLSYQGRGPVQDLIETVKYAYRTISIEYRETISEINREENEDLYQRTKEDYKRGILSLKVLARQLLDGLDAKEAASIMQYIACANAEGFNQESTNQIAINLVTEEFLTMLVQTSAEVKVMGYKVLVNMKVDNNPELKEGDVVKFFNGVTDNGSIIDFKKEIEYASGEFRIEKFNGSLYAVKDITFDIAKADFSKRVFCVKATKGRNENDVNAIIDKLKEGSQLVIRKDGSIRNHDELIAEVKHEDGGAIAKLLGVTGTVSYLKVIRTEQYPTMIMFELDDIEVLVPTTNEDIMPEIETNEVIIEETEAVEEIEIEVSKENESDEVAFEDFE